MKRKRELKRDGLNRIMGNLYGEDFLHAEDEHYQDKKVKHIIYPDHDQKMPSEVTRYFLSPEELAALHKA